METPQFTDFDTLIAEFQQDLAVAKDNPQATYDAIKQINPNFEPQTYSTDAEADILANVVAGIYAPIIHAYSASIIHNIKAGNIPNNLFLPPRDTIPLHHSLLAQAELEEVELNIITTPVNRITAGIANNQADYVPQRDPLFNQMIMQDFGNIKGPVVELETGIYGTTTVVLAETLAELRLEVPVIPIKVYGLGPNPSFIHGLFTDGETWLPDTAPTDVQSLVLGLMVFIDTLEEFGMQNAHKSVPGLYMDGDTVKPIMVPNDEKTQEIARATNAAITATAPMYQNSSALIKARNILVNFGEAVKLSNTGLPLTLKAAIPPMDNKQEHYAHYQAVVDAGRIQRTNLTLH